MNHLTECFNDRPQGHQNGPHQPTGHRSASKCEGIENLADFKAVIEELNAVDPGSYVFRLPVKAEAKDSVPGRVNLTIRDFARRMDALLELLDSTADALAAEWDMRQEGAAIEADLNGGGFEPPIQ